MLLTHSVHSELTAGKLPFQAKRFFIVEDNDVRGDHAHKECEQYLVLIKGECEISIENKQGKKNIYLNDYTFGVHLPKLTWVKYKLNGILLVFASDYYDPDDYIRDYEAFKKLLGS